MNKLEREQMEAHDREMQRPVSELFPRSPGGRIINCKGCGKDFAWRPSCGIVPIYCTSDCKTRYGSSRKPPVRRHSP